MEIKKYVKASDIPEKHLPSLIKSEIECWGSCPFDEFMICTDQNCGTMYSIEDVYGSVENYRNRKENKKIKCECGCKTEQFYKPEEFLELITEYVKGEVSAVLLLVEEEVEGFGVISKTTLGKLINLEFSTRPGSYDKEKLLSELSNNIFGIGNAENKDVVVFHQIFVSEFIRGGGNGKNLLKSLLDINPNKHIPFLLETRYDSDFYSISRSMGFENVINEQYGYVVQYNKTDFFLNMDNVNNLFKQISHTFDFYKKEALEVLNLNPKFSERKIYA